MGIPRKTRIIQKTIDSLGLNLSDIVVFTEAATGNFSVTAPIAAFAGAETVYAIGQDSSYGSKEDAFAETHRLAQSLGIEEKICFIDQKDTKALAEADIVTNTGFVRPIDEQLVNKMGGTGVISLMYEPWEYRGDVIVEACWNANIPVVGTDESDSRIQTQEYVGLLPVQLSLENNIEVMNNQYLVLGGGDMAKYSTEKLRKLRANVKRIDPEVTTDLTDKTLFSTLDGIVVIDHRTKKTLLGTEGLIDIERLEKESPATTVFHICGPVNVDQLQNSTLTVIPEHPAGIGHMSFTAGNLGPRPVIELHTAGLAASEVAARRQATGKDFQTAVDAAVSESFGADFDDEFKRQHGHPYFVS